VVRCVHLQHGVADRDNVLDVSVGEVALSLQESVHFPHGHVSWVLGFVASTRRDNGDFTEHRHHRRHESLSREFDPSLRGVGDDVDFSIVD